MSDDTKTPIDDVEDLESLGEEIELITSYLNGHLDPERVEAVRKRLDEDERFRDLAAPLLLTWSIPKHLVRHPRPEGELERDWEAFTQRVGINIPLRPRPDAPPPESRWRRYTGWKGWKSWTGFRVLLIIALGAVSIYRAAFPPWASDSPVDMAGYTRVPNDTGWIALDDRIEVRLLPGTVLHVKRGFQPYDPVDMLLEGVARFRVTVFVGGVDRVPVEQVLSLRTKGGVVSSDEAEFTVNVAGDTTTVFVHPHSRAAEPATGTVVWVRTELAPHSFAGTGLRINDSARLTRGREPQYFPHDR